MKRIVLLASFLALALHGAGAQPAPWAVTLVKGTHVAAGNEAQAGLLASALQTELKLQMKQAFPCVSLIDSEQIKTLKSLGPAELLKNPELMNALNRQVITMNHGGRMDEAHSLVEQNGEQLVLRLMLKPENTGDAVVEEKRPVQGGDSAVIREAVKAFLHSVSAAVPVSACSGNKR